MKKGKKLLAIICAVTMLFGCGTGTNNTEDTGEKEMIEAMTSKELMTEMKIGISWGNTFDAPDGEISWGQPFTTKEMIEKVKEMGFDTIRIPISWGKHTTGAPDYTIDEAWMNRIKTVVDYALDCGLYVIINSHHDNDYYNPVEDNRENAKQYLKSIWTQIATNFEYADHHLIFQTMNEPRVVGSSYEWEINAKNKDCMKSVEIINELNQVTLDAIRSTGGHNTHRFVIVSSYAANYKSIMTDKFVLPKDSVEDRLILSVHAYTPYNLCLNTNSKDATFNQNGANEIEGFMKSISYRYVEKGIPVIIDEMGIIHKDNPDARYEWAKTYVSLAKKYGMVCCWWDNGAVYSGEKFGILNRRKLEVYGESQTVLQGLMDGLE